MPHNKKPTALKILQGTYRKDRANPNEPLVPPAIPDMPSHLDKYAAEEWERMSNELYSVGVLTILDRSILAAYCEAYSLWKRGVEELSIQELTVITTNGNIIQNVTVGVVNKARTEMRKCLIELGATPSSRSRVSGSRNSKPKNPFEEF